MYILSKIKEWKKLAEGATEGPWNIDIGNSSSGIVNSINTQDNKILFADWSDNPHDGVFIAAAREAVPSLIGMVETRDEAIVYICQALRFDDGKVQSTAFIVDSIRAVMAQVTPSPNATMFSESQINQELASLREKVNVLETAINKARPVVEGLSAFMTYPDKEGTLGALFGMVDEKT